MENETLNSIKTYALRELNNNYGFCGCAESTTKCILNSDDDGKEIKITIEIKDKPTNKEDV